MTLIEEYLDSISKMHLLQVASPEHSQGLETIKKQKEKSLNPRNFLGCTRSYTDRLPAKPIMIRAGSATGAKRSLSAMGNYTREKYQIKLML